MNFFSSPEYLSAVADSFFPGEPRRIVQVGLRGETYQLLSIGRRIVPWIPFMDFLEPIPGEPERTIAYLPAVVLRRVDTGRDTALAEGEQISPLVDWSRFPQWDAFVAHARSQEAAGFRSQYQRHRKKLGSKVLFTWADHEGLESIIEWKSVQYRASGFADNFRSPKLRQLFLLLRERGLLTVSTLRADGKIVAGHVGVVWDGRFYYMLPAYDPAFAQLSVGSLVLEDMLQESHRLGHREFDFLIGNERYKWSYATGARIVGPVGVPPLRDRLWLPARERLVSAVKNNAVVYQRLQAWRRQFLDWKLSR